MNPSSAPLGRSTSIAALVLAAVVTGGPTVARAQRSATWDARAAAAYLDARQTWWQAWPNAARDHETSCVSCHTALPYALARPALRSMLGEADTPAPERRLVENVMKRVRLWKDVEPFYPDQTNGLPKSSESRGTEAILNALIVAAQDARHGAASDEGRAAFDNLWALQFKRGDLAGAWAWLNFHLDPWESGDAAYFGATLAAIAVGTEPGDYAANPDIQNRLKPLRAYLAKGAPTQTLFNRVMALWASGRLSGVLGDTARRAIVDAVWSAQQTDGGWSMSSLGTWKHSDATPVDSASDGYATGLITFALQQAGVSSAEPRIAKALAWLVQHQDRVAGNWMATSLNKKRDPASDPGKFMSDAATGYAVLALTQARAANPRE